MTDSAIIAIAAAISIAFSTIGPGLGQGKAAAAAMESRSSLIISMAMMEALTIYGLLIAFMLVAKV